MKHDLQEIFDSLLEGVVILDGEGRAELLNSEAARLFDSLNQIRPGDRLVVALGSDHPLCEIVDGVRRSGRASIHDEVDFPRRFGAPIPVDIAVSILADEGAVASGFAIALRDRSRAQSLREEVIERERQESYGHIAAGIAHEVKNPLGGIRGAAELIGMGATDERGRKASQLIVDEVDRISNLVDELMVFARGDRLELESVNVHRPLDALLDLLELEQGHQNIEIKRVYDPSLPEIQADPARLQQAFLNLARNAMQAMAETGGTLILSTRMSLEHRIVGPEGHSLPTIEISFEDNGPGIPADLHHRLSTPFFTTKREGTGLGLSVARHWIRRHDGRLRISSVPGEGARVDVHLPIRPPPRENASEQHPETETPSTPRSPDND
jgi:two-component system nitrogen regulation sensor histidine kinase GlnL